MVTDNLVAFLDLAGFADIETHRSVELEGVTTGGGFWVAEHHADLLTELVDEDTGGLSLVDSSGEFAERLGHESRLQADTVVAHIAFDLGFRGEGCHRVDDHEVNCCTADKFVSNVEGLLAAVRLRNEEVIGIHAQFLRIEAVESVLRVDDSSDTALLLHLRHRMNSKGRFTR